MTIIAATIDRTSQVAHMACDTTSVSSGGIISDCASKITRIGAALIGTSGTPSGDRFLRSGAFAGLTDDAGYEITVTWIDELVGAWRRWAKGEMYGEVRDGDYILPWWALVATPWGLWQLGSDGAIIEVGSDYAATGSGTAIALGTFACLYRYTDVDPLGAVREACQAAILHAEGCGGSVVTETTWTANG